MMEEMLRKRKNNLINNSNRLLLKFREIFDRLDVNDDGTIDFNELLVLMAIRNQMGNLEQRLAFVFDLFVSRNYRFLSLFFFVLDGMIQKMDISIEKN